MRFFKLPLCGFLLFMPVVGFAQQKIAVTDLSYKKEVREFFYYEAASSKSSVNAASSYQASGHDKSTRNSSASLTGAETKNSAYVHGSVTEKGKNDVAFDAKSNSVYASNKQSNYVKTYGDKVKVQYSELRGMSGEVRSLLINSGYKLIQTKPVVSKPGQTDDFFDVVSRVKRGEYLGSDFVLYGTVAAMEVRANREKIDATDNFMNQYELVITVDYSLIDIKTFEARAAFTVTAIGNDNRIDSPQSIYQPSMAKIMSSASKSLADEVLIKLVEQKFIDRPSGLTLPNEVRPIHQDQPNSLKVYK
jgi:hypothetical protein